MSIKNYTSTVPVINSISKIEHRLAQAGAIHITKSYDEQRTGRPVGMIFQIPINTIPMMFKLPAKSEKVFGYLKKTYKRPPTKAQLETIKMQADRTAWKILSDWIDIQVSLIELEQAEPTEIFLPYAFDERTNQTLFEKIKESNYKLLGESL